MQTRILTASFPILCVIYSHLYCFCPEIATIVPYTLICICFCPEIAPLCFLHSQACLCCSPCFAVLLPYHSMTLPNMHLYTFAHDHTSALISLKIIQRDWLGFLITNFPPPSSRVFLEIHLENPGERLKQNIEVDQDHFTFHFSERECPSFD